MENIDFLKNDKYDDFEKLVLCLQFLSDLPENACKLECIYLRSQPKEVRETAHKRFDACFESNKDDTCMQREVYNWVCDKFCELQNLVAMDQREQTIKLMQQVKQLEDDIYTMKVDINMLLLNSKVGEDI